MYDKLRQVKLRQGRTILSGKDRNHFFGSEDMTVPNADVLNSWKEVSVYIGRGIRTVQRWEKDFGLPVRRPGGHLRGSVIGLKSEIDHWLGSRSARDARAASSGDSRSDTAAHNDYQQLQGDADALLRERDRLTKRVEELQATIRQLESALERTKAEGDSTPTPSLKSPGSSSSGRDDSAPALAPQQSD